MKTGLFFGSFNPVHIGHLAIANYFREFTDIDEIWFVVSPQNPWKENDSLLKQSERVEMLNLALQNEEHYHVSDFEKELPTPSYTYQSLLYLKQKYPQHDFVLMMGGDNLDLFDKWRNWKEIMSMVDIYVYPRSGTEKATDSIRLVNAPLIDISSSKIRDWISKGKSVPFMIGANVNRYIKNNHLYTT